MPRGRNYNIGVVVEGTDNATQVINNVRGAMGGFASFTTASLLGLGATAATALGTMGFLGIKTAAELESGSQTVVRALGASADATLNYREAISDLFAQNVGDGFDQIAQTIIAVEQNTQRLGNISQPVLEQMARDSIRIGEIYGEDINETLGAATTLMETFGLTSEQAFDFIVTGQQRGLDASNDFLDTINEYGRQFANAGGEADQFFSLLETGVGSGTFLGTDRVADLFKEFRLRILDGSKATAEGLRLLGINSDDLFRQLESGSTSVVDVFDDVVQRLAEIEDPTTRMQAGFRLLGTQFEDLGDQAVAGLSLTTTELEDMEGAAERLGETTTNLTRVFRGFGRQFLLALEPGGRAVLDLVEDNLPALQNMVDRAANAVNRLAEGFARLVVDFATGLDTGGLFAGFGTALAGLSDNITFDLQATVQQLNWGDFITGVDLETKVGTFAWGEFIGTFDWNDSIITLDWGEFVYRFDWENWIDQFVWGDWITTIRWQDHVLTLDWGSFVAYWDWSTGNYDIVWGDFINRVDWSNWIYTIGWGDYVITLDWSQWLVTINWGDYLIQIDWSNYVITISWGDYVKEIAWGEWLSNLAWDAYVTVLSWTEWITSIAWTSFITRLTWSSFIPRINWRSYIPSFNWRSYVTGVNLASYVPRFPGWTSVASALDFRAPQSNRSGTPYFSGTSGLSFVHAGEALVAPQRGTQILTADRVASIVRNSAVQPMNISITVQGGGGDPDAVGRAVESGVLRAARALGRT